MKFDDQMESSGRLVNPVYAGPNDTHYRVITWEEAFDKLAEKIKAAVEALKLYPSDSPAGPRDTSLVSPVC